MQSGEKSQKIMELVDGERVLALELASLRIPSHSFEEQKLADHYANYMSDMGCDVQMMEVRHPTEQDKTTRNGILGEVFSHPNEMKRIMNAIRFSAGHVFAALGP